MRKNDFCIRYVFGALKKAREVKLTEEFIFYLRLKQLYTSSLIYKGNYQKLLSKELNLSKTSVSTNLTRLKNKGFAYSMSKGQGIVLRPYDFVYRRVLGFNLSIIKTQTWKINKKVFEKKRSLVQSLEDIDIIYNVTKLTKSLKNNKKYSHLSSGTNCLMTCDYIAQSVGRKSSRDGYEIYRRLVRQEVLEKTRMVEEYRPKSEIEEYLIRKNRGKLFYSLKRETYYKQLPNMYDFALCNRLRFTKHVESRLQASLIVTKHL